MKAWIILILGLVLVSCEKEYSTTIPYHGFFQFSHESYAFIRQEGGWIIDKNGNLCTYSNPQNWNYPDSQGYISEQQLLQNLSKCTVSGYNISYEDLLKYNAKVPSAVAGKMSEGISMGADIGGYANICYWYDESKGMYKQVILSQWGDWRQYNTSKQARNIDQWLRSITTIELY